MTQDLIERLARGVNIAMGWIVAIWLVTPFVADAGEYAFYACMTGAVLSVVVWTGIGFALLSAHREGEGRA